MDIVSNAANLLGRSALVALYVWSRISKISNLAFFARYAAAHGVSTSLLVLLIVVELAGSLLLLVGYRTRIVALALAGYTVIAILLFYGVHPASLPNQIIAFAELAAAGGFLAVLTHGAGAWSLDSWLVRGRADNRPATSLRA